jgi:hypothetical protein
MCVHACQPCRKPKLGSVIPWHYGIQCTQLLIEQAFPSVVQAWHRDVKAAENGDIDTTLYVLFQIRSARVQLAWLSAGDFILAVPGSFMSGLIMSIMMSNQRNLVNSKGLSLL